MKTIMIDPGHGGLASGAVYNNVTEKEINLEVAVRLATLLQKNLNYNVTLTRFMDIDVSLRERVNTERKYSVDLFISLHCNAADNTNATGIEIWTSKGQTAADIFADILFNQLKLDFNSKKFRFDLSDGDFDKEQDFYVLKNTRSPAILLEMGFMSNPEELTFLCQPATQNLFALSIYKAIDNYFKEN